MARASLSSQMSLQLSKGLAASGKRNGPTFQFGIVTQINEPGFRISQSNKHRLAERKFWLEGRRLKVADCRRGERGLEAEGEQVFRFFRNFSPAEGKF
ncbi:unnamed protein product [Linum trigynum]|uniref:Uncharacterized protein n=1 Tax=Linum trigynum TaxID=586398 RepID=A0AAV2CIB8_9ROSI